MTTLTDQGLFPLRLVPIETFFVADDRDDCPMTSWIEMRFASPMQRDILHQAIVQSVHRHPLLASRLVDLGGKPHWQYVPDFTPELRCPEKNPMLVDRGHGPSPQRIDLREEPGCRFWYAVQRGENAAATPTCRLTIQLHHACCDGGGFRRVLIDILSAYSAATSPENTNESPRKRRIDSLRPDRLIERGDFSAIEQHPPKIRLGLWQKIRNAHYFHFQKPEPLRGEPKPRPSDRASDSVNEPLRHFGFDEPTSSRLLELCRQREVAVNDLALAILFRTCRQWNRAHGMDRPGDRIRLLMPMDLRTRSDLRAPAMNRLSFAFLGRTHRQCESWPELLRSVQAETKWIKDTRVHMDFLRGLAAVADRPVWLRAAIGQSERMCTSVLTYTGDIARGLKSSFPEVDGRLRIGDTLLECIYVAPPARRGTNVTLGLCINWGRICISANWNRRAMSETQCVEFMRQYAAGWHRWAQHATDNPVGTET